MGHAPVLVQLRLFQSGPPVSGPTSPLLGLSRVGVSLGLGSLCGFFPPGFERARLVFCKAGSGLELVVEALGLSQFPAGGFVAVEGLVVVAFEEGDLGLGEGDLPRSCPCTCSGTILRSHRTESCLRFHQGSCTRSTAAPHSALSPAALSPNRTALPRA